MLVFVAMHRARLAAVPAKGRAKVGGTVATLKGSLQSAGRSSHYSLASSLVPLSPSIALGPELDLHLHVSSPSPGAEAALSAKREKVSGKEDSRDLLIF